MLVPLPGSAPERSIESTPPPGAIRYRVSSNRAASPIACPRNADHPARDREGRSSGWRHDHRHTAATLSLRLGVNPKVLAQRLGHADVAVTMRVYQHVTAYDDRAAADVLVSSPGTRLTSWPRYLADRSNPQAALVRWGR